MPAGVRLLQYEPKTPPVRLSICETVTDPEIFARATLGQLDACLKGRTWQAGNRGLEGLLNRLAGVGCVVKVEREG